MGDDLDTSLRGRATHAWRAGNNIELAALSKLADSHSHPENREAVASLELRQANNAIIQGNGRALDRIEQRGSTGHDRWIGVAVDFVDISGSTTLKARVG